jgi:LmbE family N-acetylglucosaminyl deacetylase
MQPVTRTIVSFHAHPDDEALLVAGTLAKAAAHGHRVVLVTATAGEEGLAATRFGQADELAGHRLAELHRSAQAIGASRVEVLGYGDSGLHGDARPTGDVVPFVRADVGEAAARLAAILREERADVLTSYDPTGGYGHPDHVQVHRVGALAGELAGTPRVLEATVDRDLLLRGIRLARRLRLLPDEVDIASFEQAYSPRSEITHRIDVRRFTSAKRAAMAAHASQATADSGDRTLAAFLRLPGPLYRLVLGREWFVERGRPGEAHPADDVFAGLDEADGPDTNAPEAALGPEAAVGPDDAVAADRDAR